MVQCCTDTGCTIKVPSRNSSNSPKRHLCFFLKDETFVSKTLNEGHVELNKFPASKVRQMAKKLESSQSTARHLKKMSSKLQATQIHLLRHQRTELTPSKFQRKQIKDLNKGKLQTRNIKKISTEKESLKQLKDFTKCTRAYKPWKQMYQVWWQPTCKGIYM